MGGTIRKGPPHQSELLKPLIKLALVAKFLGVFPFAEVKKLAEISGAFRSLWSLAPLVILIIASFLAEFGGIFPQCSNKDEELAWDFVVLHIILVITVVSIGTAYIGSFTKAKKMAGLLAGFKDAEMKLDLNETDIKALGKSTYIALCFFLPSVSLYGTFLMPSSSMSVLYQANCGHLVKFMVFSSLYFNSGAVLYEVIFVYLAKALSLLSTTNVTALMNHASNPSSLTSTQIEHHRRVQLELSALSDVMSRVFHPGMLSIVLGTASAALLMAYVAASVALDGDWSMKAGFPALISVLLLGKMIVLLRVSGSVAEDMHLHLKKASLHTGANLPYQLAQMMMMFNLQASEHPVKLTAAEYAALDTGFLKTIMANMATFLIILLQVKIDSIVNGNESTILQGNGTARITDI